MLRQTQSQLSLLNPASTVRENVAPQGTDFGYFGGGGPSSIVDRIDYSNDTATASTKGPLSVDRRQFAATGNGSFGYFAGGYGSSNVSSVDRVDYSNDTPTASPKGPLSLARVDLGSNRQSIIWLFCWWLWITYHTTIDRVDYSNDTANGISKR